MSNDKIDQIWSEERDRIKNADENTEVDELSSLTLDAQIEELERNYDRFSRAADSNSGGSVWGQKAEEALEELIDRKTEKAQNLANKHDAMNHDDFIGAGQEKKRTYSEFQCVKGEVEELQAARDQ